MQLKLAILYRTTYKTENWEEAKAIIEPNSINEVVLKPASTLKIAIAECKKRDLLSLVETNIVPRYYERFFRDLI